GQTADAVSRRGRVRQTFERESLIAFEKTGSGDLVTHSLDARGCESALEQLVVVGSRDVPAVRGDYGIRKRTAGITCAFGPEGEVGWAHRCDRPGRSLRRSRRYDRGRDRRRWRRHAR